MVCFILLKFTVFRRLVKEEPLNDINSKINLFFDNFYFKKPEGLDSNILEVAKTFNIGRNYSHAMLELGFQFVNVIWMGNTAYIKINNHIYWMEHHYWSGVDKISKIS